VPLAFLLGAAAYHNSVATSDRVAHRTWSAPCTSGSLVHAAEDRLRLLAGVRDVAVGIAGHRDWVARDEGTPPGRACKPDAISCIVRALPLRLVKETRSVARVVPFA